jgi:hypothetical protein
MEILKLVPQLFYDLISRIVPGSVAIIMTAIATDSKLGRVFTDVWDGAKAIQDSALFLGFGFLAAAYLAGQIMSPISDLVEDRIAKRLFPTHYHVLGRAISNSSGYPPLMRKFFIKELGIEKDTDVSKIATGEAVFVWFDWLRINDPDAGARAAKIRAEYRMHSQDVVAFTASLAAHLTSAYVLQRSSPQPAFIIAVIIAVLASLWATARTYRTFQWSVINQFYSAKSSVVGAETGKL